MIWRDSVICFRCGIFSSEGLGSCSNDEFYPHWVFSTLSLPMGKGYEIQYVLFLLVLISNSDDLVSLLLTVSTRLEHPDFCGDERMRRENKILLKTWTIRQSCISNFPHFFLSLNVSPWNCLVFPWNRWKLLGLFAIKLSVHIPTKKKYWPSSYHLRVFFFFCAINPKAMTRCLGSSSVRNLSL